jgi:hypothetical protein
VGRWLGWGRRERPDSGFLRLGILRLGILRLGILHSGLFHLGKVRGTFFIVWIFWTLNNLTLSREK